MRRRECARLSGHVARVGNVSRRVVARRVAPSHSPTSRKVGTQTHLRGDRGEVPAVAGVLRQHGGPAGHERVDERHRDTRAFAARSRSDLEDGACSFRFHVVLLKNRATPPPDGRRERSRVETRRLGTLALAPLQVEKQKKLPTGHFPVSKINLIEKSGLRPCLRPVKSPDSRNAWRSAALAHASRGGGL